MHTAHLTKGGNYLRHNLEKTGRRCFQRRSSFGSPWLYVDHFSIHLQNHPVSRRNGLVRRMCLLDFCRLFFIDIRESISDFLILRKFSSFHLQLSVRMVPRFNLTFHTSTGIPLDWVFFIGALPHDLVD